MSDVPLLREMVDAAERIGRYLDQGYAAFHEQGAIYDAVCLNLIRIGEAARRLSPSVSGGMPEVPWPDVISLRNRIAHGYESLSPHVLWSIASFDVTELLPKLKAALAEAETD